MRLGTHLTISAGFEGVIRQAVDLGCTAAQVFTGSNMSWHQKDIERAAAEQFRKAWQESSVEIVFSHASYLINMASAKPELVEKSFTALKGEISRCGLLGLPFFVIHPGSNPDFETGMQQIVQMIDRVSDLLEKHQVQLLLETMAGQGNSIGHSFSHLSEIISQTKTNHVGVCLDTCHIFAAGYDIRDEKNYLKTWEEFNCVIGMEKLKAIHLNDSQKVLGSKIDRHAHIGQGEIGKKGFELLMNDSRLRLIPKILETPKGEDFRDDKKNLRLLKNMVH